MDKPAKIDWNILSEFKEINNINVQKAKGVFRGREYSVWFAPSIPVFYGPLKLHGLLGAIFEVADSRGEVILDATKISQILF